MSASKVSFSVLPRDSHRLIIEIQDASGTWQMPIAREQAKILAKQLTEMSELTDDTVDGCADLVTFTEHSMVKMPEGVLWMGAMPETEPTSDAMPRHRVDVDAFELSAIVVTQGLWRHVMDSNPSIHTGSRKPVHQVSWWAAVQFCNRLSEQLGLESVYTLQAGVVEWNREANGFRLPTEAEWEFAARTREDLQFSGSDLVDDVAWIAEHEVEELPDVGGKSPNLWGFHDLSGLVFEWCWDDYAPYTEVSTAVEDTDVSNQKVCRGGSWQKEAKWSAVTARFFYPSDFKGMVGFRIARNGRPS